MIKSEFAISVVLFPFILAVWCLLYLDALYAYKLQRGTRKSAIQLSLVSAAVGIFVLQVNLIDRLAPIYSHGKYFFFFVLIECGGGIILTFRTLLRARAKMNKALSRPSDTGNGDC